MIGAMITGHRPNKLGGYASSPIQIEVRAWMRAELNTFHLRYGPRLRAISGMALGVDQWWAEEALRLGVPLHAYVPFIGQEAAWPIASREHYQHLLGQAETVVICSPGGYAARKMQIRNQRMVDDAQIYLAVWDGTYGGTANCVGYMTQRGIVPRLFPGFLDESAPLHSPQSILAPRLGNP